MFELSDDDDNFWDVWYCQFNVSPVSYSDSGVGAKPRTQQNGENTSTPSNKVHSSEKQDVPLGDITNLRQSETAVEDPVSGLRKHGLGDSNPAKKLCIGRNAPTGISTTEEVSPIMQPTSSCTKSMTGLNKERSASLAPKTTSVAPDLAQGNQTPIGLASMREIFTTPVGTNGRATPGSTPRRPKRKFPGPAGLLPKLLPGQSMDSVSAAGVTMADPDKSNKEDTVILSSQSSDDVFLDTPWQTLLSDLGETDAQLLKKFSIASISLKASKKQLVKGKVAMVFAVIECMDTHGSDASITLRDKSGRIQGTVHRDLLKDYEAELQPGTVLVLRQVSVISLTNKNHYLNITPSNIVVLYQNKNSQLQKVKFHGSQDSLRSILVSLEKKANQDLANQSIHSGHGTPGSVNSSRLSSTGRNSSESTPVLFNAVLNEAMGNLRNQGQGPGHFTPRAPGVRDVAVTPLNPGVREVRFTPSGVRTPNPNMRQNLYPQSTCQTSSGVRVPNPQTPSTSFRASSNTNNVRHTVTPGQRTTPNMTLQNGPGLSASYRFKTNSSAGVQITPVPNVSLPNKSNQNSSSIKNTPVAKSNNTSIVTTAHQRITQLSNRSIQMENMSVGIAEVGSTNKAVVTNVNCSASNLGNEVVTPKPVANVNNDKTSPELSSNKRKWSFKSPTTSPNLGATAPHSVGGLNNNSAFRNTGVGLNNKTEINKHGIATESMDARLNNSAVTTTNIGQSNNSFKRLNLGQQLNSDLPNYANSKAPSSINDINQRQQSGANIGLAVHPSEHFSGDKDSGDFNNNGNTIRDVPTSNFSKSKWSFKSKTVTSPTIQQKSSPLPLIGQNGSHGTSTSNQKVEDLWQDDLSDELLSQLSDEMI